MWRCSVLLKPYSLIIANFAVQAPRIRPFPQNALYSLPWTSNFIFKLRTDNSSHRHRSLYSHFRRMKEFLMLAFRIHYTQVAAVRLIYVSIKMKSASNWHPGALIFAPTEFKRCSFRYLCKMVLMVARQIFFKLFY